MHASYLTVCSLHRSDNLLTTCAFLFLDRKEIPFLKSSLNSSNNGTWTDLSQTQMITCQLDPPPGVAIPGDVVAAQ